MTGELNRRRDAVLAHRVVPVVVIDDAGRAELVAEGLLAGGLPVAEVTLRTAAALESVALMARRRGDGLMVGAGTVIDADQAAAAIDAGASFLVSPGLSLSVIEVAHRRGVPVIPGAVTPTEVMAALAAGIEVCKFFPAANFGGAAAIKALSAPFGQLKFVPTGGVGLGNVNQYLSLDCVPAVGGSWMVPADAIAAGDLDRLTALAAEAVEAAAATQVG